MSFIEMVQMLLGWCKATNPGVTGMLIDARARTWLNQAYLMWLTSARVQTDSSLYQTTIVPGNKLVTDVPVDFLSMVNWRILSKDGDTAIHRVLEEVSPDDLDRDFPNREHLPNTGTPSQFTIRRVSHPRETGDPTTLTVRSTANGDVGGAAANVSIVGYTNPTRDRLLHQQVRLNGPNDVAVPTPIRTLISFSKDRDTGGFVQLRNGVLAVLAELMPWQRTSHQVVLEPYLYPDATYVTEMRYNRRPPVMLNDADTPFYLPEQFHMGLVYSAAGEFGASFIDDTRIATVKQLADEWYARFISTNRRKEQPSGGFRWR